MPARTLLALAALLTFARSAVAAPPPTFQKDVLPVLTAKCLNCHRADDTKGGLDLRTRAAALAGGDGGAAVRPGKPDDSPLYKMVASDEMPPGKKAKLTAAEKALLRDWIAGGAPDGAAVAEVVPSVESPVTPIGPARPQAEVTAEVDRLIDARLKAANVPPSPVADDAEFLRRVTLDLVGRIPTVDRARDFLDDRSPDKRAKLIDELLASPEFGRHLGQLWHNRIVPLNANNQRAFDESLFLWLAAEFNKNRPWSEVVREMLTASGELVGNRNREPSPVPQIGFFMATADEQYPQAERITGSVAQLFLGTQLQCAQCHNHPFAKWKQDEFWGLAAFFTRVGYDGDIGQTRVKKEKVILKETPKAVVKGGKLSPLVRADAAVEIPESKGRVVKARFLGGTEPELKPEGPFLPAFAAWLTDKENRQFAKAGANRVWAQLFARGIVNPVNDIHDGNPPTHPELFDLIAREFAATGYDLKHLFRTLCNTRAYQRTSRPLPGNKADDSLYSHAPLKLLAAEVLYDSAYTAHHGDEAAFAKELLPVTRGGQTIRQPIREQFLTAVNSAEGGEDVTRYTHGVAQALRLMNSASVVRGDGPVVKRITAKGLPKAEALELAYLATLARRPTPEEVKRWDEFTAGAKDLTTDGRSVLWVLLNSAEFAFNH